MISLSPDTQQAFGQIMHHQHWTFLCICILSVIAYYCSAFLLTIPKALQVGSSETVSVIHRWTGINTLLFPITLMIYEATYHVHPNVILYGFTVLNIAFNCIFGALLIPKRVPKWDLPTIRIFVVASTGGLSFLCLSLNFRFGHIQSFEPIGRGLAVVSLLSIVYAVNDCVRHIQQFRSNLKSGGAMDLGFSAASAREYSVSRRHTDSGRAAHIKFGLKQEYPSLSYCLLSAHIEQPTDPEVIAKVTSVPSNVTVIGQTLINWFFGNAALLQIHYLVRGHLGMVALHRMYPKLTRMAVYGFLGAALANSFGTFAGTLVLRRQINIFDAAVVNLVAAMVPILEVSLFAIRYHEEERLDLFIWNTVTCAV